MSAAVFEERIDPGRPASFVLSAAVHLALLAVLVFGVRWQSHPPDVVNAELWEEPKPPPVIEPPKLKPRPEPAPEPEPVIERPDIAVKPPPPKPQPLPKVEPKPAPKPALKPAPPRDAEAQKRLREELERERTALAIEREKDQLREQLAREAAAARMKGLAEYEAKIRAKVRGNIVLPPDLEGNPEAVFHVVQLPTGEVISTKLARSSGHRGYDASVERAILKSSPLPRPDRPELFNRELKLTFRPKD